MENNIETEKEELEKIEKKEETKYLNGMIGLDSTRRKLGFYIESFHKNGFFKPILIHGARGNGKSMLMDALCDELQKPIMKFNVASIGSFDEFFNNVMVPHHTTDLIIGLEECHNFTRKMNEAMLSILQPNSDHANLVNHRGQQVLISLKTWTFILNSTNPEALSAPLRDRLSMVELDSYTETDLGKILKLNLDKMSDCQLNIDKNILEIIAGTLRFSAREAVQRASDIHQYLLNNNKQWFTYTDWTELQRVLNILPLGLDNIELKILKILREGDATLSHLSAKTRAPRNAIQKVYENHLMACGLLKIGLKGRVLTMKGHQYLKKLETNIV